jgi:hypothetical protein
MKKHSWQHEGPRAKLPSYRITLTTFRPSSPSLPLSGAAPPARPPVPQAAVGVNFSKAKSHPGYFIKHTLTRCSVYAACAASMRMYICVVTSKGLSVYLCICACASGVVHTALLRRRRPRLGLSRCARGSPGVGLRLSLTNSR